MIALQPILEVALMLQEAVIEVLAIYSAMYYIVFLFGILQNNGSKLLKKN